MLPSILKSIVFAKLLRKAESIEPGEQARPVTAICERAITPLFAEYLIKKK